MNKTIRSYYQEFILDHGDFIFSLRGSKSAAFFNNFYKENGKNAKSPDSEAIKCSIGKWAKIYTIVKNQKAYKRIFIDAWATCALCLLHNRSSDRANGSECENCPIAKYSESGYCEITPFTYAIDELKDGRNKTTRLRHIRNEVLYLMVVAIHQNLIGKDELEWVLPVVDATIYDVESFSLDRCYL